MKIDMTNIAYTKEYQTQRKKWEIVFTPENLDDMQQLELDDRYTAVRQNYCAIIDGSIITSSETRVFNSSGMEVYHYRNMDDSGEFIKLIHHSNKHLYLLFRIDLYGYGVFDLTERQEFFYIPKELETFIWTDVHYNHMTNALAIGGCYWACPNGVHLMDFSNPMRESKWVDVVDEIKADYDKYSGFSIVRWDGSNLILNANEQIEVNSKTTTKNVNIEITETQYCGWMK